MNLLKKKVRESLLKSYGVETIKEKKTVVSPIFSVCPSPAILTGLKSLRL